LIRSAVPKPCCASQSHIKPLSPTQRFHTIRPRSGAVGSSETFNAEFVRVRLIEGGVTALITYRNRVQEMRVPAPADLAPGPDPRFGPAREDTLV